MSPTLVAVLLSIRWKPILNRCNSFWISTILHERLQYLRNLVAESTRELILWMPYINTLISSISEKILIWKNRTLTIDHVPSAASTGTGRIWREYIDKYAGIRELIRLFRKCFFFSIKVILSPVIMAKNRGTFKWKRNLVFRVCLFSVFRPSKLFRCFLSHS